MLQPEENNHGEEEQLLEEAVSPCRNPYNAAVEGQPLFQDVLRLPNFIPSPLLSRKEKSMMLLVVLLFLKRHKRIDEHRTHRQHLLRHINSHHNEVTVA
jgi:hypothetical protein